MVQVQPPDGKNFHQLFVTEVERLARAGSPCLKTMTTCWVSREKRRNGGTQHVDCCRSAGDVVRADEAGRDLRVESGSAGRTLQVWVRALARGVTAARADIDSIQPEKPGGGGGLARPAAHGGW